MTVETWTDAELEAMSDAALAQAHGELGEQLRNLRFSLRRAPSLDAAAQKEADVGQLAREILRRELLAGGGPEPEA